MADAARRGRTDGSRAGPVWAADGRKVIAIGLLLLIVAGVASTLRLFVYPDTGSVGHADAVVVLGGTDERGRLQRGVELVKQGVAPVLLLSLPDPSPCPISVRGVRVVCVRPHPSTTQGEARLMTAEAAREGWRSLIVVSTRFQATRAKLRITRCFSGRLTIATVSPAVRSWPFQIAYEWAATAKALFVQRGC